MVHSKSLSRLLIPPQDPSKGLLFKINPRLNPKIDKITTIDAKKKVAIFSELYLQKMESF